jgi:transposase
VGCSQRIRRTKATAKFMYAALDLHERSIQCVLKDDTGKVVRESKMGKDEERILEFLDGKIRELDERVRPLAESDGYAKLLMTIPGVGHYSALLISSEIADIDRFPDHEHLCSYANLSPGVRQSRETQHASTGFGNPMLSWIIVQCTRVHVRRCDSAITRFYEQVGRRRGEKIAIVAAARKLMRAMYVMLKEEKAFRLDG